MKRTLHVYTTRAATIMAHHEYAAQNPTKTAYQTQLICVGTNEVVYFSHVVNLEQAYRHAGSEYTSIHYHGILPTKVHEYLESRRREPIK